MRYLKCGLVVAAIFVGGARLYAQQPARSELDAALDSAVVSADSAMRDTVAARVARYTQSPLAVPLASVKAELRLVPLFGSEDPRRSAHVQRALALFDKISKDVQASGVGKEAWCVLKSFEAEQWMREGNPDASLREIDACLAVYEATIADQRTTPDIRLIERQDFAAMFARLPVIFAQRARARYALVNHRMLDTVRALHWVVPPIGATQRIWSSEVTIVEFAVPECNPCDRANRAIRQLLERSRARDLSALVVTYLNDTTQNDSAIATIRRTVSAQLGERVSIANVTWSSQDNQYLLPRPELFLRYGANGSPTLFLVDRNGIVRDVIESTDPDIGLRIVHGIARIRRTSQ